MLICSIISTSAATTNNEFELNNYQLSFIRLKAKITQETNKNIAEKILRNLEMTKEDIDLLAPDKIDEISSAISITKETEYCKINENGEVSSITQNEYNELAKIIEDNNNQSIMRANNTNEIHYSETDSVFIKNLYIYKTLNAPNGTYGIIGTYEKIDYLDSTNSNKITQDHNAIACRYNLPNNLTSPSSSLVYSNANFIITCSATVNNPGLKTYFNVYCNYFHQKIGLGSINVSINFNGPSVSVSPSYRYSKYQIATANQIIYNP